MKRPQIIHPSLFPSAWFPGTKQREPGNGESEYGMGMNLLNNLLNPHYGLSVYLPTIIHTHPP